MGQASVAQASVAQAGREQAAEGGTEGRTWDRREGEPSRWYGRFLIYLELGPARSLREACRVANRKTREQVHCAYGSWCDQARRWEWRERATAWDIEQRELLAASERAVMLAMRARRVAVMEENLEAVREVLRNAHMEEADEKQARAWLPQMRVFLCDLLTAERQEYEKVGGAKAGDEESVPLITADEMRAAQREMEREDKERVAAAAATQVAEAAGAAGECVGAPGGAARCAGAAGTAAGTIGPAVVSPVVSPVGSPVLFVCAAADSPHLLDLAVLRGVRAATGLRFTRLLNATRHNFAQQLRRERNLGRPIEYLHLALPVVGEGIQFADGWADGNWLSERLQGVRVLLLAGCGGDELGTWLAVVPHVVTLGEEVSAPDAAVLTQHFWHNIGLGREPGLALEEALAYCPPAVGELVVRHW